MDTSEQYVKMCDCEEVQGRWEPKKGDYYFPRGDWWHLDMEREDEVDILTSSPWENRMIPVQYHHPATKNRFRTTEHGTIECSAHTLLPRQDQIQEWINGSPSDLIGRLWIWCRYRNATMEQLWLSFYMHEKHGKVWDGEKWVKEGQGD